MNLCQPACYAACLGLIISTSIVSGDRVEPIREDIQIIEGVDLELRWIAHVDYLNHQCSWAYNGRDNVFLHISNSVERENVLDRGNTWNFTDPMKPCLGIKKVASSNDAGEYILSMGDFGSTIAYSRPVKVTVHTAADITYTVAIGETIHNNSLKDGRDVRLPDVDYDSGSIPVSVRLPENMRNSRVSIKPSGEKVCSNSTTCESVVDLKNNSITIVLDTRIDGVGQIVLHQSVQNEHMEGDDKYAIATWVLLAILLLLILAIVAIIVWLRIYYKCRSNKKKSAAYVKMAGATDSVLKKLLAGKSGIEDTELVENNSKLPKSQDGKSGIEGTEPGEHDPMLHELQDGQSGIEDTENPSVIVNKMRQRITKQIDELGEKIGKLNEKMNECVNLTDAQVNQKTQLQVILKTQEDLRHRIRPPGISAPQECGDSTTIQVEAVDKISLDVLVKTLLTFNEIESELAGNIASFHLIKDGWKFEENEKVRSPVPAETSKEDKTSKKDTKTSMEKEQGTSEEAHDSKDAPKTKSAKNSFIKWFSKNN